MAWLIMTLTVSDGSAVILKPEVLSDQSTLGLWTPTDAPCGLGLTQNPKISTGLWTVYLV